MDDYSLPLSLTSHLLIAPLGVECKFVVLNNKKKIVIPIMRAECHALPFILSP